MSAFGSRGLYLSPSGAGPTPKICRWEVPPPNSGGSGRVYAVEANDIVWVEMQAAGYAARSINNGGTWSALIRGLNSGSVTSNILSVCSMSSGVWVSGHALGYAARSVDDAASWFLLGRGLNSGANANINALATDRDSVVVSGLAVGYASRSVDKGNTWAALPRGLNCGNVTVNIYTMDTDGSGSWVSGHALGYAARSDNNGATWSALGRGLNSGGIADWTSIVSNKAGTWVAVAVDGYAARSVGGIGNWAALPRYLGSEVTGNMYRYLATDGNGLWVCVGMLSTAAASRSLSYSTDDGVTWKNGIANSFNSAVTGTALAYGSGRFIRGTNSGTLVASEL